MTKHNERAVFKLLEAKYPKSEYALFPQVPDGTGSTKRRTADAICMSLWPSRGLEVEGFEIKVSRPDWLKELNGDPSKAESWAKHCDRWWIVAPAGIVKKDELPKTWGLLSFSDKGLRKTVPAPLNESVVELSKAKIAGLFRAARQFFEGDCATTTEIEEAVKRGVEQGKQEGIYRQNQISRELKQLKEDVRNFEEKSGVQINRWAGSNIGESFRKFREQEAIESRVKSSANRLLREIPAIKEFLESLADD